MKNNKTYTRQFESAFSLQEDGRLLSGRAMTYNSRAIVGDPEGNGFYEEFAPGSIRQHDRGTMAYLMHDSSRVLGSTKAGTMRIVNDDRHLSIEVDLPNTPDGNTTKELVERGDLEGLSIGFKPIAFDYNEDENVFRVTDAILAEVSAVSKPVYVDTTVDVRSVDEYKNHLSSYRVAKMNSKFNRSVREAELKLKLLIIQGGKSPNG